MDFCRFPLRLLNKLQISRSPSVLGFFMKPIHISNVKEWPQGDVVNYFHHTKDTESKEKTSCSTECNWKNEVREPMY